MFQRPERASFISTNIGVVGGKFLTAVFQRPERASFISTTGTQTEQSLQSCFNALNGLLSFLP